MKKRSSLRSLLPMAVLFALLLAAINPSLVFAEGEAPETPSGETPSIEPLLQENNIQDSVEQMADNQAAIIDQNGSAIPLASQTALDALTDPDPWFYGSLCSGGICKGLELTPPNNDGFLTLQDALSNWVAKKGYGMIYLEGGFHRTEDIIIDGAVPGFGTLRGIVWDTTVMGAKPALTGYISATNFLAGFRIEGLTIVSDDPAGILMQNNAGAIVLRNLDITNSAGFAIRIINQKGSISLDQAKVHDSKKGTFLDNYYSNGSTYVNVGGITVTNSKFMLNGTSESSDNGGLVIRSKGAVLINGVSSIGNFGNGFEISGSVTSITMKNIVASDFTSNPATEIFGNGIYIYQESNANITLDNVYIANNENRGAMITTRGNVILKKVVVNNNVDEGILISQNSNATGVGAKNVTVTESVFYNNGKTNLNIIASGVVIINILTSTNSLNECGLFINNSDAATPQAVILTNSVLNKNALRGGSIVSKGAITANGITANGNGSFGLYLENFTPGSTGNITLLGTLGTNQMNNNSDYGFYAASSRNISVSSLQTNGNSSAGVLIYGNGISSNVILTGIESLNNLREGIKITTTGTVTATKVTASDNENTGMKIVNKSATTAKSVLVTNSTFNANAGAETYGLYIESVGFISLNNIIANENNFGGAYLLNNNFTVSTQVPQAITVIKSSFNKTVSGTGLLINSNRKITLTNISASDNGIHGISADNSGSTVNSPIVLSGVNRISGNSMRGIDLHSYGPVTVSGINAIKNDTNYINSEGIVTLTNSQFSDNINTGINIDSTGNIILKGITVFQNGFSLNDAPGVSVIITSGRLYVYNSIFMGNSGAGLYADVPNQFTDFYLAPTNIIVGNDAGAPYDDKEGVIY